MKGIKSYWFLTVQTDHNAGFNITCGSNYSVWEMDVIVEAIKKMYGKIPDNGFLILFALELTLDQYLEYSKINQSK